MAQYLILIYENEESYAAATPEDYQNIMEATTGSPSRSPGRGARSTAATRCGPPDGAAPRSGCGNRWTALGYQDLGQAAAWRHRTAA